MLVRSGQVPRMVNSTSPLDLAVNSAGKTQAGTCLSQPTWGRLRREHLGPGLGDKKMEALGI